MAASGRICDNGPEGPWPASSHAHPRPGGPLDQVTLELPTQEIALQTWLVMQQGGLVIPVQDVQFEAEVHVELAFGFCPHRYELVGTVVANTPHGTALQLGPIPDPIAAFFRAVEQGVEPPDPPVPPPSPRSERQASKLTGDFWSTVDEFSEIMLGGDPDEELEDALEESSEGELAPSLEESASVVVEIQDTGSLELPAELVASLERSAPPTGERMLGAETEEVDHSEERATSPDDSAEYSESSASADASQSIAMLTGEEDAFERMAHTLLGIDREEAAADETIGDVDAAIEAMLDEVGREDTLTEMAEPSIDHEIAWSAVPWTRRANRHGSLDPARTGALIRELTASRDTGILRIDLPDRTVYSLWLAGSPVFVTADPPEEGGELEHALASLPLVDATVFQMALAKSAEQDRHLALVLIDVGVLQTEDVRDLMRLMARRAVRMLPMLPRGRYQFWECAVPMADEGVELELELVLAWEPGVSPPSEESLL